jgi:hypothetical protein
MPANEKGGKANSDSPKDSFHNPTTSEIASTKN